MNLDPDKDEKIDISLSSLGDGENPYGANQFSIADNQQNLDPKTAAKTKKIEEDSDEEEYKKNEQNDKTAEKMMRNPFKT